MSIDEAIEELTESYNFWMQFACDDVLEEGEHKVNHCEKNANYCYQLIKWLEELKAKRNIGECAYKQGYNKAIDDAVKVIENSKSIFDNSRHCSMGEKDRLQNFIKKLKDGGKK